MLATNIIAIIKIIIGEIGFNPLAPPAIIPATIIIYKNVHVKCVYSFELGLQKAGKLHASCTSLEGDINLYTTKIVRELVIIYSPYTFYTDCSLSCHAHLFSIAS